MIFAFVESIKYVGHLLPISLMRIFLGYYYFHQAYIKLNSDFLTKPIISGQISEWLPSSSATNWYKIFVNSQILPHWQGLAFTIIGLEFAIGFSYMIGYVVRPMGILAALLTFNIIYFSNPIFEDSYKILIIIHIVLAWVGAGRCLGIDYYFFKRQRGIWW